MNNKISSRPVSKTKTMHVWVQFNAKLYVFDKAAQTWLERGRGLLRLNDMSANDDQSFHSRLGKYHVVADIVIRFFFCLTFKVVTGVLSLGCRFRSLVK